ncbi:uncharacterized protein LOC142814398 [Rhipicephalus microplus]|uniref:uncharacterized protein LOC142814398 n=1 Tax=Rhipicephalus microplus TaxID=6941 RepID=UPI003F6C66AB
MCASRPGNAFQTLKSRISSSYREKPKDCPRQDDTKSGRLLGKCPHYAEKSWDIFHMVWACQSTPCLTPKSNPARENWEAALLGCSELASQKALVNRARVALDANGLLQ